ncbi:hypothetical protein [Anaerosacchariphilus polymeriproducens]|uniref:DUF2178 domain-containing protein n=1 Tax=Anaerosacchariphilus polymeriproducens TaxID=1812858 RepID=A0A371AWD2_9FIRM|nr:hypothetical protein [Anaerosacchariphilus polymeriproducens]RDU23904.1 hypothetical protein DWV06_06300 [Anaerosacchariphilus polymeriproducens]
MLKKKSVYVIQILIGVCLIGVALAFRVWGGGYKNLEGVCIGIGAGLFGIGISNFFKREFENKNPDLRRKNEIEYKDERNTMIRNRAKARAADIIQWCILGLAYITILINAAIWVTLVTTLVFLVYHILTIYFMNRFSKEM